MPEVKYSTALSRAEAERRPVIEASQERLRLARETLPERAEELESANDAVDDIEAAWRKVTSDIDPQPAQYAEALAARTRAELRYGAAETEVTRAASGVRSLDLTAAEIIASVVRKAYASAPTHVTFVDPRGVKPRASELPQIVVWSPEAPTANPDGTVSCSKVEVVEFREGKVHAALDHKHILEAAEALHVPMQVGNHLGNSPVKSVAVGGLMRDVLAAEIRSASPGGVPIIAEVDQAPRSVSTWLTDRIAHGKAGGNTLRSTPLRGSYYLEAPGLIVSPGAAKVLEETTDETGLRTIVVDSSIYVRVLPTQHADTRLTDVIDGVLSDIQRGRMFGGLGVSQSAELVEDSDLIEPQDAVRRFTDRLVPFEAKPQNSSVYERDAEKSRRFQLVVRTEHLSRIAA